MCLLFIRLYLLRYFFNVSSSTLLLNPSPNHIPSKYGSISTSFFVQLMPLVLNNTKLSFVLVLSVKYFSIVISIVSSSSNLITKSSASFNELNDFS